MWLSDWGHTCREWFAELKNGDFDLNDRPRSGGHSELDNDVLEAPIVTGPRLSSTEMTKRLSVCFQTICNHLHQLGKVNKMDDLDTPSILRRKSHAKDNNLHFFVGQTKSGTISEPNCYGG